MTWLKAELIWILAASNFHVPALPAKLPAEALMAAVGSSFTSLDDVLIVPPSPISFAFADTFPATLISLVALISMVPALALLASASTVNTAPSLIVT